MSSEVPDETESADKERDGGFTCFVADGILRTALGQALYDSVGEKQEVSVVEIMRRRAAPAFVSTLMV